jgi:hypothetical protein
LAKQVRVVLGGFIQTAEFTLADVERTMASKNGQATRPRLEVATVSTVRQYLGAIDRVSRRFLTPTERDDPRREIFFRGQPNADDPLRPKIDRPEWVDLRNRLQAKDPKFDRAEHERWLLKEFQKAALPHLPVRGDSPYGWEWLAAGQHYGLATRLLDWTASPLAALFFAVDEHRVACESSAVFAYLHCGDSHTSHPHDPLAIPAVVSFTPRHVSPRITAQAGRFTAHPETCPAQWEAWDQAMQGNRIVIARDDRKALRRELARLGITRSVLFPDAVDGIAATTNYRFMTASDELPPSANKRIQPTPPAVTPLAKRKRRASRGRG